MTKTCPSEGHMLQALTKDETDAAYAKRIKDSFDNAKWQSAENVNDEALCYLYTRSQAQCKCIVVLNTDETEKRKKKTGVVTQNVKRLLSVRVSQV